LIKRGPPSGTQTIEDAIDDAYTFNEIEDEDDDDENDWGIKHTLPGQEPIEIFRHLLSGRRFC
jgi:hypothetical protein